MQKGSSISRLLIYSTLLFLFSACSARNARNQKSLFNSASDIVTDTIKNVYVVNDQAIDVYYKIKPFDLLAIRNIQNKEFGATGNTTLSGINNSNIPTGGIQNVISYEVAQDGNVNLPAIGKVFVAGLTRREATVKIETIYSDTLLDKPIIELSIVNLKVTLLGEFTKQGNYLLQRDNMTLVEIIGEAGGIPKTADPKTLKIIRGNKKNPEQIYVNLTDINSLASNKLILQNGDIIVIQTDKSVAVGDKLQKFNTIIQPLLVVVNLAVLIFTLTR